MEKEKISANKGQKHLSKLEQLYDITRREDIYCAYADLHSASPDLHGCYINDPSGGPVILLDRSLERDPRLHLCVLGEEIGHYYTTPRTDLTRSRNPGRDKNHDTTMAQDEGRALRWAADFLIPDRELLRALSSGMATGPELAEHFGVTVGFMDRKLEIFRRRLQSIITEKPTKL